MATINITQGYSWISGEVVTPAKMNQAAAPTAALAPGSIVNADVDAAAAIAGTKVAPNFGSQNVATTGTLLAGAGSVITGNSATTALRVTQEGSGNALVIEDDVHPDNTPLVINNVGQIISGATEAFSPTAGLQLTANSNDAPNGSIAIRRCNNAQASGLITFLKSRGTSAAPIVISSGDTLGGITAQGYDGSSYTVGARIEIRAEGTPSAGNVPSRIAFLNNASGSLTERMRIDSAGNVGIGTTANAAAILDVSSTTKGFLPPRMTTAQRDAISTPPAGLMLYNTSTNKLQVRTNTAWADLH